jgi:hypothetical protein
MDMVALRAPLIEMLLALHVHQVEFVNEPVSLEQAQSAVHSHSVDAGVELARLLKDLRSIQVLLGGFYNSQDRAALPRKA